jgi:NitT/TauT family transport system substrate-binding protein
LTLTRRKFVPTLASSLLVGCHRALETQPRIRLAVSPRVTHAPLFLAYEQGLFRKEGLDVQLVEFSGPLEVLPAIAGNRVDAACFSFTPGLCNAVARGARIRIVAVRDSLKSGCSDQGALYYRHARFSQGVERAEDWNGARVALPADNNSASFYLNQILSNNKIPASAVEVSRMRVEEAVAAASAGHIDVFFGSGRPEFLNGGLPKGVKRSDLVMDLLGELQYTYIVFGSMLLDGDPKVGTAFLRAYLTAARRFVNGETPKFLDDLATRMHMNPELVKAGCRSNLSTDGEVRIRDIDRWVQWAVASGAATGPITADQLVDSRFQQAAVRTLPDL